MNGLQATRSAYDTDGKGGYDAAPGGTVTLNLKMLDALLKIGNTGAISISEIAGGQHKKSSSLHYTGRAFDINRWGTRTTDAIVQQCIKLGAGGATTFEPGNTKTGKGAHVHCEWKP